MDDGEVGEGQWSKVGQYNMNDRMNRSNLKKTKSLQVVLPTLYHL